MWLRFGDVENPQIHQSGQGDGRGISNHISTFLEKVGEGDPFFFGGTTARHQGKLGNTVGKPKCRAKGGKSKRATQGERLGYLVEGQSKGRRGTDIPRVQSMHL